MLAGKVSVHHQVYLHNKWPILAVYGTVVNLAWPGP